MNHPNISARDSESAVVARTSDAERPEPSGASPTRRLSSPALSTSWRQSPRDLVTIGLFAALYLVTVFVFVLIGFTHPVVMLASAPLGLIAGGIPFMLFLSRVHHGGMVFLFGALLAALHVATGHPLVGLPLTLCAALAAELILRKGRYRSQAARIGATAVFGVWSVGPWLPLFLAREEFLSSDRILRYGPQAVQALQSIFSPALLVAMVLAAVACAALGGLLGARLMRRHFAAAGLA